MARFEYTKTVEYYSFTPPRSINEALYEQLKSQIKRHPNLPLVDEEVVEKSHNRLSGILLVGIIALVIGLFGMFSNENPPGWSVILMLISVFGVLHPIVNMGTYDSSKNRIRAERERISYFRKLKDLISNSKDYKDFKSRYPEIFGYYI
jgi:hypothetical protein